MEFLERLARVCDVEDWNLLLRRAKPLTLTSLEILEAFDPERRPAEAPKDTLHKPRRRWRSSWWPFRSAFAVLLVLSFFGCATEDPLSMKRPAGKVFRTAEGEWVDCDQAGDAPEERCE